MLALRIEQIVIALVTVCLFGLSVRDDLWPWAKTLWNDRKHGYPELDRPPVRREFYVIALLGNAIWFSASAAFYLPTAGPVLVNMVFFPLVAAQVMLLL